MTAINWTGGHSWGLPLMKFTLTYEGELGSSGNSRHDKVQVKWDLRKHFHPQLQELRLTTPALDDAIKGTCIPPEGQSFGLKQFHHKDTFANPDVVLQPDGWRDLYEPLVVKERSFLPIIRDSLALACELDILFLRKEPPGKLVTQGGDLDNRIKTLLDALRMPKANEVIEDASISPADPIYCLLEDDTLVTRINVRSDRLLTRPNAPMNTVHLVIGVDIRVLHSRFYNLTFLAD